MAVAPDDQLPCHVSERPPVNWHPHAAVLSWANLIIDKVEWTDADRKALATDFSPDPAHDHLFTAVPPPANLLKAIKDPLTWERDYMFRRAETERLLHEANKDLTAGLRPLLEVLSATKNMDGMLPIRVLLSKVFSSMASSASYISRGRRELARKFVPLDNAAKLFTNKPSHLCYFGHETLEAAVEDAVAAKKVNKELVRMPRKTYNSDTQQSFQKFPKWNKSGRGFQNKGWNSRTDQGAGKFQGGQQKTGKKRGSRGRGRGRGAKKPKE